MPERLTVTLDANRLTHPTQRKFNAAWMERLGQPVQVLPEVALELMHRQISPNLELEAQIEHAVRELQKAENVETNKELLIREFDLWWAREFASDDTPYELVQLDAPTRERAERIAENIAPDAFPRVAREDVPNHPDTVIIAQAIAAGHTMLITGNMNSVEHDVVNDWAAAQAHHYGAPQRHRILHVQDTVMPLIFADRRQLTELQFRTDGTKRRPSL
ncbi:MAG: hypothetical protein OXU81_05810 [Gammaproteobacteria bacterium]|nr:hypothetical protein [Gammaproteobacteria bacterium]